MTAVTENDLKRLEDLIVNLSASPYSVGKQKLRESLLSHSATRYNLPIVYGGMFSPKKKKENPNPVQSLGKKRKKPRPLKTPPRRVKTKPKSQQPHRMKFP